MISRYLLIAGIYLVPVVYLLALPVCMNFILRSWRRTLNWQILLILASAVAFLGYFRLEVILAPPLPIPATALWALKILSILSPAILAAVWLRLKDYQLWQTLLLFPFVPVGVFMIWLFTSYPRG